MLACRSVPIADKVVKYHGEEKLGRCRQLSAAIEILCPLIVPAPNDFDVQIRMDTYTSMAWGKGNFPKWTRPVALFELVNDNWLSWIFYPNGLEQKPDASLFPSRNRKCPFQYLADKVCKLIFQGFYFLLGLQLEQSIPDVKKFMFKASLTILFDYLVNSVQGKCGPIWCFLNIWEDIY